MPPRTALLYMTHFFTPEIRREVEALSEAAGKTSQELWLLLDARTPGIEAIRHAYPLCHVFEERAIMGMPYPRLENRPFVCHVHFCVLDFYLSHRDYDYYWLVESDVRFTGKWSSFFGAFSAFDHDLLTSHIRSIFEEPLFSWWNSLSHPTKAIPRQHYLRSFNVIYRISNSALKCVHEAHLDGWRGFAEVLYPTLLAANGFTLLDLGGDGKYTPPGYKNRFYTSYSFDYGNLIYLGTVRYRPSRGTPGIRRNKLYHPVKPKPSAAEPEPALQCFVVSFKVAVLHLLWRIAQAWKRPLPP